MTAMSDTQMRERIDGLEEQLAHQIQETEELSNLVREQWKRIDDLTEAVMRLRDRLSEVEDGGTGPHVNTRPPHY